MYTCNGIKNAKDFVYRDNEMICFGTSGQYK